jgi:hypothetical protein
MPRTHDDSWDLANSVGATATMVATSRALASQGPDALLDDPFADPLVRAVGLASFVRILDGELSFEDDPWLNRKTRAEQIAVRTRFFDDFFTTATDAGVRQAVILASGLDTRAYRLRWPNRTAVFEIDQPQVIDFKTKTLANLGAGPTAERRAIGIDLRDATGRPRCERAVSTSLNLPPGAPKDCCPTCPPKHKTGCSTTSPRSARRAVSSPPNMFPTQTPTPTNGWNSSASDGGASVSTSMQPSCSTGASAASSSTTSPATTGR